MRITTETIISFDPILEYKAMKKFEERHPDWKKDELRVLCSYKKKLSSITLSIPDETEIVEEEEKE